jgi:hypothetical protein
VNSAVYRKAWFWIWPPSAVTATAKVNVRTLPGARAVIPPTHLLAETVHESLAEAEPGVHRERNSSPAPDGDVAVDHVEPVAEFVRAAAAVPERGAEVARFQGDQAAEAIAIGPAQIHSEPLARKSSYRQNCGIRM